MYGLSRLQLLQEINLSNNAVVTIEGLKELIHLRHLNLQGNTIKSIEHINTNVQLEYLNLAENSIGSISDISVLKNLKVTFFLLWHKRNSIFYPRHGKFINISSACDYDYELCRMLHPSFKQIERTHAIISTHTHTHGLVIAVQWAWTWNKH